MKKKEKFLRCKLVKGNSGITLIGIYEKEVEKEVEKEGKKVKETVKEVIEKPEIHLSVSELDKKIKEKLIIYGLFVKVQRATAGLKSEEKKLETWKETIQILKQGNWERKPSQEKTIEKAKQDLINSIKDPILKEKLKKELGLA